MKAVLVGENPRWSEPQKLDGLINDLIFGELGIVPGSFRLTSVWFCHCCYELIKWTRCAFLYNEFLFIWINIGLFAQKCKMCGIDYQIIILSLISVNDVWLNNILLLAKSALVIITLIKIYVPIVPEHIF